MESEGFVLTVPAPGNITSRYPQLWLRLPSLALQIEFDFDRHGEFRMGKSAGQNRGGKGRFPSLLRQVAAQIPRFGSEGK